MFKYCSTVLMCLFMFSFNAMAASSIGSFVGSLSGTVTAPDGTIHQPNGSVDATVNITTDASGAITGAVINGSGACNAGLGIVVTFNATFNVSTSILAGTYTDSGSSVARPLTFTNTGGLTWSAPVSGSTPSENGLLPYNLTLALELPSTAIYTGTLLPTAQTFSGPLATTFSVPVTIGAPVNQTVTLAPVLSGSWTATSVPLVNGSVRITGTFSGTLISPAVNITTLAGPVPVSMNSTFNGTLHTAANGTLSIQGSWTDTNNPTGGGTMSYSVPLNANGSISNFSASYAGGFNVSAGGFTIPVTFSATGTIPFVVN